MGKIVFLPPYNDRNAFRGIEQFSHLWVLFDFSEAHNGWSPLIRPPKLGGNKKIGVFASRSPFRPNNIGLSSVKLVKVDYTDGVTLLVEGVDILDETPIYDIKPYLKFTDSHPDATCGYADEHSLDSLSVNIPQELLNKLPEDKRAPAYPMFKRRSSPLLPWRRQRIRHGVCRIRYNFLRRRQLTRSKKHIKEIATQTMPKTSQRLPVNASIFSTG